jgi:hypothetical protein
MSKERGLLFELHRAQEGKILGSNRVISKVTLSSPSLWACFHPLSPLSVVSTKLENFIISPVQTAETRHLTHKIRE